MQQKDMEQHSPLVQKALSLDNASIAELKKARVMELKNLFGRHERDTATPAITASCLCEKVLALLNHVRVNPRDKLAYIRMSRALKKRRKYLLYLKRKDANAFHYVCKYYGIQDEGFAMHKSFKKRGSVKAR